MRLVGLDRPLLSLGGYAAGSLKVAKMALHRVTLVNLSPEAL
jgi:hypothetical protein